MLDRRCHTAGQALATTHRAASFFSGRGTGETHDRLPVGLFPQRPTGPALRTEIRGHRSPGGWEYNHQVPGRTEGVLRLTSGPASSPRSAYLGGIGGRGPGAPGVGGAGGLGSTGPVASGDRRGGRDSLSILSSDCALGSEAMTPPCFAQECAQLIHTNAAVPVSAA